MNARPLIVRFGALGDMILTTGLMRALHQRHGQPCDVVTVQGPAREAFKHLPFVGDVITIASRKTPYWFCPEQWRLVERLRTQPHDPVYLLQHDAKSERLLRRARQAVAGSAAVSSRQTLEHVVDHYLRLACVGADARAPELRVSAEETDDLIAWLRKIGCESAPLVLVQPGNRRTMRGAPRINLKYWPDERWIAVMRGVLEKMPSAKILVVGSLGEKPITDALRHGANDARVLSVAGDLPLRRLFALLKRAHSLISVDTGPAHAAAALGCPLVVLFGKADPRAIAPVSAGSPVVVVTGKPIDGAGDQAWADYHDMLNITQQQALNAWLTLAN
jgi:heptosyltransferase-2/heptosyltransferase-3